MWSSHWVRYAGRAMASSPSLAAISVLVGLELWERDVVGAALVPLAVVAIAIDASTCVFVRGWLDRAAARRARARVIESRIARAAAAGVVRRLQLAELTRIVDELGERDGVVAERLELDELVEHFAQRCTDERANDNALRSLGHSIVPREGASPLTARRLACQDERRRRAEAIAHDLDAIVELAYYIAQAMDFEPIASAQCAISRSLAAGDFETSPGVGSADLSQPPPSASTSATADVIC